jgi:holin-like protein
VPKLTQTLKNKAFEVCILLFSLAIFFLFVFLGEHLNQIIKLPIPDIVLGMLLFLLFIPFVKAALPKVWNSLQSSADQLLPFLPLFILPSCVGILNHLNLLKEDGATILIALVIGIFLSQLITPLIFRFSLKLFKVEKEG